MMNILDSVNLLIPKWEVTERRALSKEEKDEIIKCQITKCPEGHMVGMWSLKVITKHHGVSYLILSNSEAPHHPDEHPSLRGKFVSKDRITLLKLEKHSEPVSIYRVVLS